MNLHRENAHICKHTVKKEKRSPYLDQFSKRTEVLVCTESSLASGDHLFNKIRLLLNPNQPFFSFIMSGVFITS